MTDNVTELNAHQHRAAPLDYEVIALEIHRLGVLNPTTPVGQNVDTVLKRHGFHRGVGGLTIREVEAIEAAMREIGEVLDQQFINIPTKPEIH